MSALTKKCEITPCFVTHYEKIFRLWFAGSWIVLFPQEINQDVETYCRLSLCFLNAFAPEPQVLHLLEKKKSAYCESWLKIQNRWLPKHQMSEADIFYQYQVAVYSERIHVQFEPIKEPTFNARQFPPVITKKEEDGKILAISKFVDLNDEKKNLSFIKPSSLIFGPFLWFQLFLVALYTIFNETQKEEFIQCVFRLLSCEICQEHSQKFWRESKITDPFQKLLALHNNILQQHKKPLRTENQVRSFMSKFFQPSLPLYIDYRPNRQFLFLRKYLQSQIIKK